MQRFRSTAIVCLVLLASVFLSGCAATRGDSEQRPVKIRVMTFNIHHGRGADERVDLERIAAVIRKAKPDIVGLQEVDRFVQRSGNVDIAAELARLTGMRGSFAKNIAFQEGDYGNGMLTRFPILQGSNTHYRSLHPGEQRGLQHAVLDVNGRKLVFMNTHMDFRPEPEERLMNIDEIEAVMNQYSGLPIVFVGDLNDEADSRTHHRIKDLFTDAWELIGQGPGYTYLSYNPHKRLDYIMVSDPKVLRPVKIKVIKTLASDHNPVVADIILK